MAFTPKTWATGDVITAAELNRIETGVNQTDAKLASDVRFIASGRVASDGTGTSLPSGWSSSRTGTGEYTINMSGGGTAYSVVVQPITLGTYAIVPMTSIGSSAFYVDLRRATTEALVDASFTFQVVWH